MNRSRTFTRHCKHHTVYNVCVKRGSLQSQLNPVITQTIWKERRSKLASKPASDKCATHLVCWVVQQLQERSCRPPTMATVSAGWNRWRPCLPPAAWRPSHLRSSWPAPQTPPSPPCWVTATKEDRGEGMRPTDIKQAHHIHHSSFCGEKAWDWETSSKPTTYTTLLSAFLTASLA